MLHPFRDFPNLWTMAVLTDEINRAPVYDQQISRDLDWNEEGVYIPFVTIDQSEGFLDTIVDSAPYNGVPTELFLRDGDTISLDIPSHPAHSILQATEITARRELGQDAIVESIARRKAKHNNIHQVAQGLTTAVDRIAALQGIVYRKNGAVKYNLAAKFGRGPTIMLRQFADVNFGWIKFFRELKARAEEKAQSTTFDTIDVFAAPALFELMIASKDLRDTWKAQQTVASNLQADLRGGFQVFSGVWVTQAKTFKIPGTTRDAFPLDAMIAVPRIAGLLQTRQAPRQNLEFQHTEGVPLYLESLEDRRGESIDFWSEANQIHYVRLPEVIIIARIGNQADEPDAIAAAAADVGEITVGA